MSSTHNPVHSPDADRRGGWNWRAPSRGEHYRTCSYCGSINPEDLANETGWQAQWADAKYGWPHKFYVDIPNREPDRQFIISASNAPEPPGRHGWISVPELPAGVSIDGWRDLGAYSWVLLGQRRAHHAKFYTAHLADPAVTRDVVERVQNASGLRFDFRDSGVTWSQVEAAG
jgi:hypothetical protein